MGKGDKKSRRGKIILGTYGVRRHKKKAAKAAIKHSSGYDDMEIKDKKSPKAKKEIVETKETSDIVEVKELKPVKETKATKSAKETGKAKTEKEKTPDKGTPVAALTGEEKNVKPKKEPKDTRSEKTGTKK